MSEEFRIAQVLRDRAAAHPEDVALVGDDGSRETYGELEQRSNRLARYLLARGVTAGDRVVHLDRNAPGAAELLVAAAKVGAAIVPVNWRLAVPELEALVADSRAKLLVCGPAFVDTAGRLGAGDPIILDERAAWLEPDAPADDPHQDGDLDATVCSCTPRAPPVAPGGCRRPTATCPT